MRKDEQSDVLVGTKQEMRARGYTLIPSPLILKRIRTLNSYRCKTVAAERIEAYEKWNEAHGTKIDDPYWSDEESSSNCVIADHQLQSQKD